MGYSYENWEIFEKFFEISEKNPKKFKNIDFRKIILFFEKELYFARSATSPWVPPCFLYIFVSSPKMHFFMNLYLKFQKHSSLLENTVLSKILSSFQ